MAEDRDLQDKTEEATAQRREDFRKQGQVAQTRELSTSLSILTFALLIWFLGRIFLQECFEIYNYFYSSEWMTINNSEKVIEALSYGLKKIFFLTLPVYALLLATSFFSTFAQIGFLFSDKVIEPNLQKINPLKGIQKLFSLRSLVEGIKALFKLFLVGFVIYFVIKSEYLLLPKLIYLKPIEIFYYVGFLIFKTTLAIGGLMGVLAGFDYLFQRFDLEKEMKMTKQEVKEEVKSREGDPLIKVRIRKTQKEMSRRRMMEDVAKADVILTNPTHLAVALKYNPEKYPAPVILAKGAGFIAEKIREKAKKSQIPIVENKPLARTIYKSLDIGQMIPRELFAAVAEVLAYVFKLKKENRVHG